MTTRFQRLRARRLARARFRQGWQRAWRLEGERRARCPRFGPGELVLRCGCVYSAVWYGSAAATEQMYNGDRGQYPRDMRRAIRAWSLWPFFTRREVAR